MESENKVRINLTTREFEVFGSEKFVNSYADKVEELYSMLKTAIPPKRSNGTAAIENILDENESSSMEFGEMLHKLTDSATDADKMLLAGWSIQSQSSDNSFNTKEANDLLKDQGVKLVNAAQAVKSNTDKKRVFVLQKGRFRVSKLGVDLIMQWLSSGSNM